MPIDDTKVTAAPCPLEIGGQTFMLSPMTDVKHSEMNHYVRQRHIRMSILAVKDLEPELVREVTKVVTEQAHGLEWNKEPAVGMFKDVECVAQLMWVGIRDNDKKATVEKIQKALLTGDVKANVAESYRVYKTLNEVKVKNSEPPAE